MEIIRYFSHSRLISNTTLILTTLHLTSYTSNLQKEGSVRTWRSSSRPTPNFTYVTAPGPLCTWTANTTSLLVGVATSADHFDHRSAIRETWGAALRRMGFKLLFLLDVRDQVLQRQILKEHTLHGDILQGQFADTYENLTYKTVMLVHWAQNCCAGAEFVMKIDDDMLLSVWDLAVVLSRVRGINHTIWGRLFRGFEPIRDRTSKWYVSPEIYAPDIYPDFLSGTAYVISGDSIPLLIKATYEVPFFSLEDVYVTGFIGERMQISRLEMGGFFATREPYQKPCAIPRLVTSHMWSPAHLRVAWKNAVSRLNERLCEEGKSTVSY